MCYSPIRMCLKFDAQHTPDPCLCAVLIAYYGASPVTGLSFSSASMWMRESQDTGLHVSRVYMPQDMFVSFSSFLYMINKHTY